MKKLFLLMVTGCSILVSPAFAQEDVNIEKKVKGDKGKKESQEIVIRSKVGNNGKITVIVDGDNVTVNGKPLSEFKDDNVTVNKRKSIIRNRDGLMMFDNFAPAEVEGFPLIMGDDNNGKPQAFLGVTTSTVTDDSKEQMPNGAEITFVTKGTAAEKAGLKEGDVIYKINDKKVDGPAMLSEVVTSFKPKDEVTIYYKRDGKDMSTKAVLGERKESNSFSYSFSGPGGMARAYTIPRTPKVPAVPKVMDAWSDAMDNYKGFDWNGQNNLFGETFPRHQKLGLKIQDTEEGNGVKVLNVEEESAAAKAGLKKDDVITEIAGKKVNNTDEAREMLQDNKDKASYSIKAKRNGSDMSFEVKIPKKLKTTNL